MPVFHAHAQHQSVINQCAFLAWDFKYVDKPAELQEDHIDIFAPQALLFSPHVTSVMCLSKVCCETTP